MTAVSRPSPATSPGPALFRRTAASRVAVAFLLLLFFWCGLAWCQAPGSPAASASEPPFEPGAGTSSAGVEVVSALGTEEDAGVAELLRHRFAQIEGLDAVKVEVRYGIATLEGTALSFQAAERAVGIAGKTGGVVAVENRIRIETDLEERVVPAYERSLERLRDIASYSPLVLLGLGVVALFVFLARILASWDALFRRLSANRFVQDLARQVLRAAVIVVGVVIALDILDATALVGAVLGSVGVLGLAVGFAFRDLAENYISSVLLSVRRPFSPNDHVVIGPHEGKVMRLTSRATILMTLDGNHLRIPNADVFKGVILNYSRNPRRRFDFAVGVGVQEDLLEAQALGLEQLETLEGVLFDPSPEAVIAELGDSNVVIRFYGWVDQRRSSFLKVKAEAIRRVKLRLESAGMDLPEPIYRVMLERRGKAGAAPVPTPAGSPVEEADPQSLAAGEAVDEEIARERAEEGGKDLLDPRSPEE